MTTTQSVIGIHYLPSDGLQWANFLQEELSEEEYNIKSTLLDLTTSRTTTCENNILIVTPDFFDLTDFSTLRNINPRRALMVLLETDVENVRTLLMDHNYTEMAKYITCYKASATEVSVQSLLIGIAGIIKLYERDQGVRVDKRIYDLQNLQDLQDTYLDFKDLQIECKSIHFQDLQDEGVGLQSKDDIYHHDHQEIQDKDLHDKSLQDRVINHPHNPDKQDRQELQDKDIRCMYFPPPQPMLRISEEVQRSANMIENTAAHHEQRCIVKNAEMGNLLMLQQIIKGGASVNMVDDTGCSALHRAAGAGKIKVVQFLLEKGAQVNQTDSFGKTALHWASESGHCRVVNVLVDNGASINKKCDEHTTALHWAAAGGHSEIVNELFKRGACLDKMDDQKQTPLHWAAANGRLSVVKLIVRKGANTESMDKKGDTPLKLARRYNYKSVCSFLKKSKLRGDETFSNTEVKIRRDTHVMNEPVFQFPAMINDSDFKHLASKGTNKSYKNRVYLAGTCFEDRRALAGFLIGKTVPEKLKSTKGMSFYYGRNGISLRQRKMIHLSETSRYYLSHVRRGYPRYELVPIVSEINVQNALKQIRDETYTMEIAPVDLLDIGGHKSFEKACQLFVHHKGTLILMFDGSKDIYEPLKEYPLGDITTASFLTNQIDSFLTYCTERDEKVIVFAATNVDKISRRVQAKKITEELTKLFCNHHHEKHIYYDRVFYIDLSDQFYMYHNSVGLETEFLKNKLVDIAFKQTSWGETMPIAWAPLDLHISELRSRGVKFISMEKIIAMNHSNDDLALTADQLKHFLNVQHSLGEILYFDEPSLDTFIIVEPTLIMNILELLHPDELFLPRDETFKKFMDNLYNTGMLKKDEMKQLLVHSPVKNVFKDASHVDFILNVLVHLDIFVQPQLYTHEEHLDDTFLVPCVVKDTENPQLFNDVVLSDNTICLVYEIEKPLVPSVLFYRMIGAALNVWPLKKENGRLCLFNQSAIMVIDCQNELRIRTQENNIIVYLTNMETKQLISPGVAASIQACLTAMLTKIVKFYQGSFGKFKSQLGVSNLFIKKVGLICENEPCVFPVTEAQDSKSWCCEKGKIHDRCYPMYWEFNRVNNDCPADCTGLAKVRTLLDCNTNAADASNGLHSSTSRHQNGEDIEVIYRRTDSTNVADNESPVTRHPTQANRGIYNGPLLLSPNNQHFVRLASQMSIESFSQFYVHLGMTSQEWESIEYHYDRYGEVWTMLMALHTWQKRKESDISKPTLGDLLHALSGIEHSHYLCKALREDISLNCLAEERLQIIPMDSTLQKLTRHLGNCVVQLGIELGLEIKSVKETMDKYPKDMYKQISDILVKWKQYSDTKPTVYRLMVALLHTDSGGLTFLREENKLNPTLE